MINKCKVLMTSRGLYKGGGSPYEEGDGKKEELRTEEEGENHSL